MACKLATQHLDSIADSFDFSETNLQPLLRTCMTTLSSKMCAPLCGSFADQGRQEQAPLEALTA